MKVNIYLTVWCWIEPYDLLCQPHNTWLKESMIEKKEYMFKKNTKNRRVEYELTWESKAWNFE